MSTSLCKTAVDGFLSTLANDIEVMPSDRGCHLITPFIRPDGEAISLYVESRSTAEIRVSDAGDTLGYLYVNGLTLTRTLLSRIRQIARSFDATLDGNALICDSVEDNIGEAVHNSIQAILAVTSLINGRRASSRVLFDNEVESYIINTGVTYDFEYAVPGLRESHAFKFHINSGRNLLVQPLSASTESAAHSLAERWSYRFIDTVERDDSWRPLAVLDDRGARQSVWTAHATAPIYDKLILWANRQALSEMLVT